MGKSRTAGSQALKKTNRASRAASGGSSIGPSATTSKRGFQKDGLQGLKARESEERKFALRKKIDLKRLSTTLEKAKAVVTGEKPLVEPDIPKEDPNYALRGAANAARDTYFDPVRAAAKEAAAAAQKDYLALDGPSGQLWNSAEGREYLSALLGYAVGQHKYLNKSTDAAEHFEEMMKLDSEDHLAAKQQLLRMHLDNGDALAAREVLDRFPNDKSACFAYNHALVELISLSLEEEGSSLDLVQQLLNQAAQANPHVIWMLAFPEVFAQLADEENMKHLSDDGVKVRLATAGSVEEAFLYFSIDYQLWEEIDGALDVVKNLVEESSLEPPVLLIRELTEEEKASANDIDSKNAGEAEVEAYCADIHNMFSDLFNTGIEEIEEILTSGV